MDRLWKNFAASGTVADYLKYRMFSSKGENTGRAEGEVREKWSPR